MAGSEMKNMLDELISGEADILSGIANLSYSYYYGRYYSAVVLAVPYDICTTTETYVESVFEGSIARAKRRAQDMLLKISELFSENKVGYWVPPLSQENEEDLQAIFSYKFAAVNAGVGWIGKNGVLTTRKYGPRVLLGVILTDIPLPNNEPFEKSLCPEDCFQCVEACPHSALKGMQWDIDTHREEMIDYRLCNAERSRSVETIGRKHACGLCLAACPIGADYKI